VSLYEQMAKEGSDAARRETWPNVNNIWALRLIRSLHIHVGLLIYITHLDPSKSRTPIDHEPKFKVRLLRQNSISILRLPTIAEASQETGNVHFYTNFLKRDIHKLS
jgi:hypothetical protein